MEIQTQLTFDGIFKGREHEIRITPYKQISVFDFIKVVGGQKKPHQTWERIFNEHKDEVSSFIGNLKFPGNGQKLTPVINVQGMVKLLFWLPYSTSSRGRVPGELAKQFRSKSAETMIRYLGPKSRFARVHFVHNFKLRNIFKFILIHNVITKITV